MKDYRVGVVGCGRMAGSIDDEVIGYDACILPYSHAAASQRKRRRIGMG